MKHRIIIVSLLVIILFFSGIRVVLADSNSDTEHFGFEYSINYTPIRLPKDVEKRNSIDEIHKDFSGSSHVIISLELLPASIILKRGVMTGNFSLDYYLVGEEIVGFAYGVETIPKSLNISKILLTLILPNSSMLFYTLDVKEKTNLYILEEPLKFKDKGLLQIEMKINTSEKYIVWRNLSYNGNGMYLTYHPEGNITGESETYFDIYRQAIPILTPYEAMMIGERIIAERGIIVTERGIIWGFVGGIVATLVGVLLTIAIQFSSKKRYRRRK